MKNKIKYITTILGSLMILSSCTGKFEEYNTDPAGFSDSLQTIDYNNLRIPLKIIQQGIYFNYDWGSGKNWPYQIMQNLGVDMFSGYMHDFNPFNGGTNNSDYNLQDGWNGSFWENTYAYIFPQVLRSEERSGESYPGFLGVTKILKVELMHRVTDIYGPLVYTHFGDSKVGSLPDTQKEAYYAFFTDLDTGVKSLTDYIASGNAAYDKEVGKEDILTGSHNNYEQWIKFANSLRLRLAVRIAMVDPAKAKIEAQKALTNSFGLLQASDDVIAVSTSTGVYTNPTGEINRGWSEVYMNANMESILNGYQDPRMPQYYEPATDPKCLGQYKGIRQGTAFAHKNYINHSKIYISKTTNAILMTAAEVWFLRAEAALRGWSSESVAVDYAKGVETSFAQWNVTGLTDYLKSDKVGRDYVDVFDVTNNIPAVCKVSPKWDDNASNEVKLEKIITQKWLAVFPEGCEAWAEQRRTGYPKLFPVKVNNSKGTIDTKIMIRRLNFPVNIISGSPDQYSALCTDLGGADNGGTRLWWDTGKNF